MTLWKTSASKVEFLSCAEGEAVPTPGALGSTPAPGAGRSWFLKGHLKWFAPLYKKLPLQIWKLLLQLDLSVDLSASRVYYF